jgi:hypothetical protein
MAFAIAVGAAFLILLGVFVVHIIRLAPDA